MKIFNLPDLGEGLPDAEIIEWHVTEGDNIELDEALVSMETAKAVVEVPSPYTGKVSKLYGQAGDVIETGKPLAGFTVEGEPAEAREEAEDSSGSDTPASAGATDKTANKEQAEPSADAGTVVGKMEASDTVVSETLTTVAGVKVTPAVRALATKLKVKLAMVAPTGKDGVVTRADVENAASNHQALPELTRPAPASTAPATSPVRAKPPSGEWEPIRGTRRTMARVMSESHAQVVPTSIMDDADVHLWSFGQDMTVRLLRSIWAGARAEPGLNAWYDAAQNMRMIHKGMDVGMAVHPMVCSPPPCATFTPALLRIFAMP